MHYVRNYEPSRFSTPDAFGRLRDLFDVRYEDGMQDYPLEVADPARTAEFCTVYETGEIDEEIKFVLMQLILFSLNDRLSSKIAGENDLIPLALRVEQLLRNNFLLHFHTIDYWRCAKEENDPDPLPESERIFSITPMMRQVWKQCYKSEFARWLSDGETV